MIWKPITTATTANGAGNETTVGAARLVLVQNTSAVSADVLVTLRSDGDPQVVVGTFYVNGDSSVIITKETGHRLYAADANVYFTGIEVKAPGSLI